MNPPTEIPTGAIAQLINPNEGCTVHIERNEAQAAWEATITYADRVETRLFHDWLLAQVKVQPGFQIGNGKVSVVTAAPAALATNIDPTQGSMWRHVDAREAAREGLKRVVAHGNLIAGHDFNAAEGWCARGAIGEALRCWLLGEEFLGLLPGLGDYMSTRYGSTNSAAAFRECGLGEIFYEWIPGVNDPLMNDSKLNATEVFTKIEKVLDAIPVQGEPADVGS